jgi:hypothetical protein
MIFLLGWRCTVTAVNYIKQSIDMPNGSRLLAAPWSSAGTAYREGQLLAWGIPATGVLVETLLDRGADGDVDEADTAIARLTAAPDDGLVIGDIWLFRLRALLARAKGDDTAYRDYRDRYRDMAKSLGFEGHIAWAEAMT